MNSLQIKAINKEALADLMRLSRQTFSEAFAAVNEDRHMTAYMDEAYSAKKLGEELENPDSRFFFVYDGGEPLAYLKLNFNQAQSDIRDPESMEIERIYVLQAHLGKGIGKIMMNEALAVAKKSGVRYVWLGVWEHNERALAFYKKHGFELFGDHVFWLGEDRQIDLLMRKFLD